MTRGESNENAFTRVGEAFFLSFVLPCFRVVLNVEKKEGGEAKGMEKGDAGPGRNAIVHRCIQGSVY